MVDPTKNNEPTIKSDAVDAVRKSWAKPILETRDIDETELNVGAGADSGVAPSDLS
jgi:hypothetical protein